MNDAIKYKCFFVKKDRMKSWEKLRKAVRA